MPRALPTRKVRSASGSNSGSTQSSPDSSTSIEPVVSPIDPSALPLQASDAPPVPADVAVPDVVEIATTPVSSETDLARIDPADTEPVLATPALPVRTKRASAPPRQNSLMSKLLRFRAGWGWVFGVVALGFAFFGEKLAEDNRIAQSGLGVPPLLSWIFFGAAAILFALGIAPAPSDPARATPRFFLSLRSMSRLPRVLFLVLLVLSLVSIGVAVPLFLNLSLHWIDGNQGWLVNTGSWLLFIFALVTFGLAWVIWERNVPGAPKEAASTQPAEVTPVVDSAPVVKRSPLKLLSTRYTAIIMLALFVLALAFRLPGLDSAPPGLWFDEAQNGIVARNLYLPDAVHPAFIADLTQMGALYFYFLGLILKVVGTSAIWPLRLLPALGGALIAPMLFLIGMKLYGWRVGLVAGVLVALGAWNITMSRFGMVSLPTVAVDVATYLCLVQALKTGRFGWWAGSGVLLGLALQMYYPSQLVPAVLLLVFVHRLISGRMSFFRAIRAGVVAFVVGLLIAVTPVATFAAQHTEVYTQRAGDVNIFTPIGSEGRPDALWVSIQRHALMFNYAGDRNPRHNLPGAPMLDWITAALFLGGFGVLVLRAWRWQYFFPLVWLLLTLSGGILSVVFEAPQAHRTLENSVVAPLIAAIFLGELWAALDVRIAALWLARQARRAGKAAPVALAASTGNGTSVVLPGQAAPSRASTYLVRGGRSAIALAFLLLLTWVGFINIDRYFNKQANDLSVWLEMGGENKAVGQLLASYDPSYRLFVSPIRTNVPATLYLAPNKSAEVWLGSFILPFVEERDVVVLIDPSDEADVADIVRIYPHAQVQVVTGPQSSQPQLFAVHITTDDIKSLRGVHRIDDAHSAASLKVDQFSTFSFGWQNLPADGTPQLFVDGTLTPSGRSLPLGAGLHSVVISGTEGMKADFNNLLWAQNNGGLSAIPSTYLFDPTKVEPHGLTALIRPEDSFTVAPTQIRIDPQVSFYFHITPLPRPYTIDWVGKIYAPISGSYTFFTEQLSRSHLLIDGKVIVRNESENNVVQGSVSLREGLHDIELQYEDLAGFSHAYLYWQPPTIGDKYIIPSTFLWPQLGSYPTTPASGSWPTIDQTDDTTWAKASLNPAHDQPVPDTSGQPDQPTAVPQPEAVATPFAGKLMVPSITIGNKSTSDLPLPRAVAVAPDGTIYIYTESDSKISKYKSDGTKISDWAALDSKGVPVTEGAALLIKDGNILFLSAATAELVTYTPDGKEVSRVPICNCYFPRGMALANDGNLWVVDTGFGHVFKVNLKGETITTMGGVGTTPGLFTEPASVWESPQGYLFVADVGNKRMQSFTPDGKPLAQWPLGEGTSRDANRITGMPNGDVLVAEYSSRAVVEYDNNGKELHRWTYAPSGLSFVPVGIAPAGGDKYAVLFPFDSTAIEFDATP